MFFITNKIPTYCSFCGGRLYAKTLFLCEKCNTKHYFISEKWKYWALTGEYLKSIKEYRELHRRDNCL
jgi:hypothetical protein